jgi:peptide/nickel transport system permease protein
MAFSIHGCDWARERAVVSNSRVAAGGRPTPHPGHGGHWTMGVADSLAAPVKQRNLWLDAFDRFRRNRLAVTGLAILIFILVASVVGPWISPYNYLKQDLLAINQRPNWSHPFGTDGLGRDYLTRIMMGGRTAFLLSTWVVAITTLLGVVCGALSAYLGGWVDTLVMRFADTMLAFPHLLLALFLVGTVRPPVTRWLQGIQAFRSNSYLVDYAIVFGALAAVGWAGEARLVRSQILSLREREFVEAERALGASGWRILRAHLIPNALGPVVVSASSQFGGVLMLEAALSYFGVGVRPPGASWGNMVGENMVTWRYDPHLLAFPGIVLAITVLAFNFVGDGVNDALDPRRGRRL